MSMAVLPLVQGLLIFMRFIGMLATAPLFGLSTVPWPVRIALAACLSWLLSINLPLGLEMPRDLFSLGALGLAEVLLGIAVGFTASLFVYGVRMAGQVAGIQMGLGFSSLVDPMNGGRTTVLAHFLGFTALSVILAFNGHHVLLKGVALSLQRLPPGSAWASLMNCAIGVPAAGATLFVTAVVVAAPSLAIVFCLKVGMALLARAAPQLHVLAVGFIVTIVVGVFGLAVSLTGMGDFIRSGFERAAMQALNLCAVI